MYKLPLLIALILFLSCSNTPDDTIPASPEEQEVPDNTASLYFPPNDSDVWETVSITKLGWNASATEDLKTFLAEKNTESFIILKDGRIALEYYFNEGNINKSHSWNSAAKTLVAFTIGLAQQQNYLDINDRTSKYLGVGWTSMTTEQESKITIKNQLSMTSGGDYTNVNLNCKSPDCLKYRADAGTEWYYYNAYYQLLKDVITEAVPTNFNTYFTTELSDKIGMDGFWLDYQDNNIFLSTARSMARFGLLNLNKGNWDSNQILNEAYFKEMTNTSQNLNLAYGYLWWLNGKESYKLPIITQEFQGKLIPNAPDDLIAGLGKFDQKLYVVPSEGIVIVRMGDSAGNEVPGPSGFDDELWGKINKVIFD